MEIWFKDGIFFYSISDGFIINDSVMSCMFYMIIVVFV